LNDPAIVQVYEFSASSGQPYIAMQYIDGCHLGEAELDERQIVGAIRRVAQALAHAHAQGIVHRDVKPANILLDRQDLAYLTDFGIAGDIQRNGNSTLSREGFLAGTPALMPPEQARGQWRSVDARSDIYSLGASLYLLLCGRYPFDGDSIVDVLHAVLHDEPPLPRAVEPSIPRALEAVLLKCLRKERGQRYQSMHELIIDLDAYCEGRTATSGGSEWLRRLVGAESRRPTPTTDLVQSAAVEIAREIATWDTNLYRVSRNLPRLHPQLEAIIERLDGIIEENPDYAWAHFYRGMALFRLGRLEEALDAMERSIDRMAGEANARFEMGRLYLTLYLRDQQRAYQHLNRSGVLHHLDRARGRLEQAAIAFSETERLKSDLLAWQFDYSTAVSKLADQDYEDCVEVCDRILADDADVEEVWKLRGDALRFGGGDPFPSYAEAIRVRRSYIDAYMSLTEAYVERGNVQAAHECLDKLFEVWPDHLEALALRGRACLMSARAATERDHVLRIIKTGLEDCERVLRRAEHNYGAIVTRGELLVELARLTEQMDHVEAALASLSVARGLAGCQNRVECVAAAALLERARLKQKSGANPRSDLEEIIEQAQRRDSNVPGNETWMALLGAARAQLAALAKRSTQGPDGKLPSGT
jgi:tetratricopeptide (TPR) repeat protein